MLEVIMVSSLKFTISLLKKYLRLYVKQVLLLSFFLVLYNLIQIFNPQIIRYYIDTVFEPTLNTRTILFAALLYIGMNLILRAIMILNEYFSNNLAWATTNDLRIDTTRHCINLDMTFHNKHKTGEMIERIDGDASTLSEFFSTFVVYFLGSILLLIGVLIAVFIEGWIYGVIFLGFTLISLVGLYFVRKISAPLWKKVRESTTEMYGNIEESISGLEDIKGNGADEFIMKSFHGIAQTNYKNKAKAMIVSRTYYAINVLMNAVLNIGILVTSYYLSNTFGINGGSLFLLSILAKEFCNCSNCHKINLSGNNIFAP